MENQDDVDVLPTETDEKQNENILKIPSLPEDLVRVHPDGLMVDELFQHASLDHLNDDLIEKTIAAAKEINDTVHLFRKICEFFRRSGSKMKSLSQFIKPPNTKVYSFYLDVRTRWNSTCDMLKSIIRMRFLRLGKESNKARQFTFAKS